MTIKYLGNAEYRVTTAGERPSPAIVNSYLLEQDTKKEFYYNGTTWIEQVSGGGGGVVDNLGPTSMTIYRSGSLTKVRNNVTGVVSSTTWTDATDSSPAFNYAIQNLPTSAVSGTVTYKGGIGVLGGVYNCKTLVDLDGVTLGYHGVQLIGEGPVTRLNFTPSSTLTNAIRIRMGRPRLSNLRIYGSSNVTNLVQLVSETNTPMWWGMVDYVQFDGANYNTGGSESSLAEYQAGQTGLKFDGQFHSQYFWNINNCAFRGLEYGINLADVKATSTEQSGNYFLNCRVGEKMSASQNNINNVWIQGSAASGDIGIWLVPAGSIGAVGSLTNISNVQIEMFRTASIGAGLGINDLPRSGAIGILKDYGTANIRTSNVVSTSADGGDVVDLVTYSNFDTETRSLLKPSASLRAHTGIYLPGATPKGGATGILWNNLVESVAPTLVSLTNGPAGKFSTGTTINTIRYMYFSNTAATGGDSMWGRSHNPQISVRFLLGGTNATAGVRLFIGLWTHFSNPTATADFLASRNGVGLWLDTDVSSNFRVMHNNGAASSSFTNFDNPITASNATGGPVQVMVSFDTDLYIARIQGRGKPISTSIPASGHHGFIIFLQNTTTDNKDLNIYEIEMLCKAVK